MSISITRKEPELTTKVDSASSTVTYLGFAAIGAATSELVWQIQKIVESGDIVSILWADANKNFDNEWDERESISYS